MAALLRHGRFGRAGKMLAAGVLPGDLRAGGRKRTVDAQSALDLAGDGLFACACAPWRGEAV